VRHLKPNLFGMALLRRLNVDWLVGSGCTCLKRVGLGDRQCGNWWWTLNMVVSGVGGTLMESMSLIGWDYEIH
jgi:hypothetical protein